ncbi:MAG: hypothetical protein RL417_681, partial [Pseudomonadota bacterium]
MSAFGESLSPKLPNGRSESANAEVPADLAGASLTSSESREQLSLTPQNGRERMLLRQAS